MAEFLAGREVPARDEGRHSPGSDRLWNESWYFDFANADGSVGGYARLGLYPNLGVAWWWAVLVREGHPLLLVRHHEVAMPRGESLEIRGEGLWGALYCETPNQHWTVGLEAFAVALEHPLDALGDERGHLTPLGFDLEWETVAPAFAYPGVPRYEVSSRVTGEVLVGTEAIEIDAFGQRDHSWGNRDWWTYGWCWTAGRLDDGTAFHASRPDIPGVDYGPGYLAVDGRLVSAEGFQVETTYGEGALPDGATMAIHDLDLRVTPLLHGPLRLESPDGRVGHLARALCRFEASDGRTGHGWGEWNQPPKK
ncbi:MAG: hypothetical protein ACR2H3_08530 [Acidimicrobiales bacterium]